MAKTKTSFNYSRPSGGWSGLDMGRKVRVDRIVYTPRNRDNYIRPGDTFELLYCDKEWKSMGKKQKLFLIHWFIRVFLKIHFYYCEIILAGWKKEFLFMKTGGRYANK